MRGCSRDRPLVDVALYVVPARAGLFPPQGVCFDCATCGPRACGAVPRLCQLPSAPWSWSPRVRGCSLDAVMDVRQGPVVPARAGLSPGHHPRRHRLRGGPRACGAVPTAEKGPGGYGWWSPRVRGCSLPASAARSLPMVVPARAGLFPARQRRPLPAHGGPRACGAVPKAVEQVHIIEAWSPRVRGCSRLVGIIRSAAYVVPARAGLSPRCRCLHRHLLRGPAHEGLFPGSAGVHAGHAVVPACAGLTPEKRPLSTLLSRGPRACGAVARQVKVWPTAIPWSPRVRGCSRRADRVVPQPHVVPARAGLFPHHRLSVGGALSGSRARRADPCVQAHGASRTSSGTS